MRRNEKRVWNLITDAYVVACGFSAGIHPNSFDPGEWFADAATLCEKMGMVAGMLS
jgi:hypothetical protein